MSEHYDVIIIGTGAGGGTLLNRLAPSGKNILVLERGPFLPREKDNWNYHGSFKYYSSEVMFNKEGGEIRPGFSYFVGGNTKIYGAALFRLREKDFESFRHRDGISPEWRSRIAIEKTITRRRRNFMKFTARPAKTRPNRGVRMNIRIRRSATSRALKRFLRS